MKFANLNLKVAASYIWWHFMKMVFVASAVAEKLSTLVTVNLREYVSVLTCDVFLFSWFAVRINWDFYLTCEIELFNDSPCEALHHYIVFFLSLELCGLDNIWKKWGNGTLQCLFLSVV